VRPLLLFAAIAGCGGRTGAPEHPKERRPPPALVTFLPPGADWILEARPKALWESEEVRRALAGSIGESDLVQYRARTGVDLRAVEEAIVCGYGQGSVWIARGGQDPHEVGKRLRDRLHPVERDDRRRGLGGVLFGRPVGLRRLGPRAVAFGDDAADALAHLAPGRALDRNVAALAERLGDAPLVLLRLGPLDLPRDSGAGMLLSRIVRSGFALAPDAGALRVRVVLIGELPSSANENLRALVDSLGQSGLGRAFGADAAARRAGITVTPRGAEVEVVFDPAEVDTGVRTLFVEDLRGLFPSG
jgi:hypothetical protein